MIDLDSFVGPVGVNPTITFRVGLKCYEHKLLYVTRHGDILRLYYWNDQNKCAEFIIANDPRCGIEDLDIYF